MWIENLTGENEIGANCYLLQIDDFNCVLDAGMNPKRDGRAALPVFERLDGVNVEGILVSHAHLDHIGGVPTLMQIFPGCPVYMTSATSAIATAMLHNSVNVMQSKRLEEGILEYPLYKHTELDRFVELWSEQPLKKSFTIDHSKKVKVTFHDAGHILGSAGMMIEAKGKKIFYTGDVQFENQTMIPGAKFPEEKVDVLIMECTRGAVERRQGFTRKAEELRLANSIDSILKNQGAVLIPVFALGKTQEVLMMLHQFKKEGLIPESVPVFIGGLSTKVTTIFDEFANDTPRMHPGFEILEEVDLRLGSKKKRKDIPYQPGAIFVLSSGMMTEKTLSNKFASHILPNPKNGLFFVGYVDPDSPAGVLKETPHGQSVQIDPAKPKLPINCVTDWFDFSGHSVRESLIDYACKVQPDQIFLVHGDRDALDWMKTRLAQLMPKTKIIIPELNQRYAVG